MFSKQQIEEFLRVCPQKRVLVVGDVMLDHYIWGMVERISPEAPVPVVHVRRESFRLGGAANVAHNVAALGARVALSGIVGRDFPAQVLEQLLSEKGVDTQGLLAREGRQTTKKTRVIAHHQQVARIDREDPADIPLEVENRFLALVEKAIPATDAVILSDYNKGLLTARVIRTIIDWCRGRDIFVAVDPKKRDWRVYSNASIMTPNFTEFQQHVGESCAVDDRAGMRALAERVMVQCRLDHLLVTLGEHGMAVFGRNQTHHPFISTRAKDVYDVTGAGDTVISSLVLAHAAGLDIFASACLANTCAGLVVRRVGTTAVSGRELLEYYD